MLSEQQTVVKNRGVCAALIVTDDGRLRPPRRVRVAGEHGSVSWGLLALMGGFRQRRRYRRGG